MNGQATLCHRRSRFIRPTSSELATGRVRVAAATGPDWRLSEAVKSHLGRGDETESFVKSAPLV